MQSLSHATAQFTSCSRDLVLSSSCTKLLSPFSLYNRANLCQRDLRMIRAARSILVALLAFALSYGLDCVGLTTPEQSRKCCNRMGCHSPHHHHRHGTTDCCNAMPQIRPSLGHPASVQGISFLPVALGLVSCSSDSRLAEASGSVIRAHSHDPPLSCIPANAPLRI